MHALVKNLMYAVDKPYGFRHTPNHFKLCCNTYSSADMHALVKNLYVCC